MSSTCLFHCFLTQLTHLGSRGQDNLLKFIEHQNVGKKNKTDLTLKVAGCWCWSEYFRNCTGSKRVLPKRETILRAAVVWTKRPC